MRGMLCTALMSFTSEPAIEISCSARRPLSGDRSLTRVFLMESFSRSGVFARTEMSETFVSSILSS